jgi:hypothetical protein
MADDFLNNLMGSVGVNFEHPITLAINLFLSTLIGGIFLIIIVEILGKKFKEKVHVANAFLVVLIINIINILGVIGFIYPLISFAPFISTILPIIIWILLIKIFFKEMKFTHAIIVGIIGYALTLFFIPTLVGIASGFMPSF